MSFRRAAAVACAALTAISTSGCGQFRLSGIDLARDTSITFTTEEHADLALPFHLAWHDDDAAPDRHYAVVVNRTPPPPGETLRWFAKGDKPCLANAACPDDVYLLRKGVVRTDVAEVDVRAVPVPLGRGDRSGLQTATVIVLDDDGRRVGEAAFTFEFTLDEASR